MPYTVTTFASAMFDLEGLVLGIVILFVIIDVLEDVFIPGKKKKGRRW